YRRVRRYGSFSDRWADDHRRSAGRAASACRALTSAAGDVLFEKIRMLRPSEFDGKTVFGMAHDTALHLAERDYAADRRPLIRGNGVARFRHVNDAAADIETVRHDEPARRIARHDAAVAAILGQAEDVAVGEPCELGRELIALACGCPDGHGEAVLEGARDTTFEAAEMIHIGDDALARRARNRRNKRHAAGRHVDDLAGKLAAV